MSRSTSFAQQLVAAGAVREESGRWLPRGEDFPAARIALRSASADNFHIVDSENGEVIGTVEAERAFTTTHPGAVYLHIGRQYEIDELDIELAHRRRAAVQGRLVHPAQVRDRHLHRAGRSSRGRSPRGTLNFGHVAVSEQVIAYQRKSISDHETLALESLDLPPQHFMTQALWYTLDDIEPGGELPLDVLQGSLHAAEHAQIAVLPLIAMCDRWDIGGLSTAFHPQTGKPTIFIYDGHPGGVGITERGYEQFERLTADAHAPDRRVQVRERLPELHPEPEVRQPQRAAAQGRSAQTARLVDRLTAAKPLAPRHRTATRRRNIG